MIEVPEPDHLFDIADDGGELWFFEHFWANGGFWFVGRFRQIPAATELGSLGGLTQIRTCINEAGKAILRVMLVFFQMLMTPALPVNGVGVEGRGSILPSPRRRGAGGEVVKNDA